MQVSKSRQPPALPPSRAGTRVRGGGAPGKQQLEPPSRRCSPAPPGLKAETKGKKQVRRSRAERAARSPRAALCPRRLAARGAGPAGCASRSPLQRPVSLHTHAHRHTHTHCHACTAPGLLPLLLLLTRRSRRFLRAAAGRSHAPRPPSPALALGFPGRSQPRSVPSSAHRGGPHRPPSPAGQKKYTKIKSSSSPRAAPTPFPALTFHLRATGAESKTPPLLEVGVRGNTRRRRLMLSAAAPLFWPLPAAAADAAAAGVLLLLRCAAVIGFRHQLFRSVLRAGHREWGSGWQGIPASSSRTRLCLGFVLFC